MANAVTNQSLILTSFLKREDLLFLWRSFTLLVLLLLLLTLSLFPAVSDESCPNALGLRLLYVRGKIALFFRELYAHRRGNKRGDGGKRHMERIVRYRGRQPLCSGPVQRQKPCNFIQLATLRWRKQVPFSFCLHWGKTNSWDNQSSIL